MQKPRLAYNTVVGDIALEGGPYPHKYRAAQFHFHWGKTSQEGAEHLIDGKAFAAEVIHATEVDMPMYFCSVTKSHLCL